MKRTVKDATRPITFTIDRSHAKAATCRDPEACVIARALSATFGDLFQGVHVGATVTKVFNEGRVIRYATPSSLRKGLLHFDETGEWDLPDGEYKLLPPSPTMRLGARPNRWKRVHEKKTSPGRDAFRGRAMPSRKVMRVETLQDVPR